MKERRREEGHGKEDKEGGRAIGKGRELEE